MTPDDAVAIVRTKFPFKNYILDSVSSYQNIAECALRYLMKGEKILDFGSGPMDKTAVLQILGFDCSAVDDLSDDWHARDGNRERIILFSEEMGIDFYDLTDGKPAFHNEQFGMIMAHDVLEHLHDSPRELLNDLLEFLAPNGILFITVPNAVNLRKRIHVLFGRTNLPPYESFYWHPGQWRGHVREYVKDDLVQLNKFLGLELIELKSVHNMIHKIPTWARPFYKFATLFFPGWRDTWSYVARKPENWKPRREIPVDEFNAIMKSISTAYH